MSRCCRSVVGVVAVVAMFVASGLVWGETSQGKRPIRVDDLFDKEEIEDAQFSPDGQTVVFTRLRPASSQLSNGLLIPQTRGDIWLQLAPDAEVKNLTHGAAGGSGWWVPRFRRMASACRSCPRVAAS